MNGIKRRAEQFRRRINASHQMPPLNLRSDLECCLTPDDLGREIRRVWVDLARQEPNPKSSHLVGWDELDEQNKAIDREIGQALLGIILTNTVCNLCLRSGRGPKDDIDERIIEEREDAPLPADIASDNPDDWAIEAEQNQEQRTCPICQRPMTAKSACAMGFCPALDIGAGSTKG